MNNDTLLRTQRKESIPIQFSHSTRTSSSNSMQQEPGLSHFSKRTCGSVLKSHMIFVHQNLLNTKRIAMFKFLLK